MNFSDNRLRELSQICSSLSLVERKALITPPISIYTIFVGKATENVRVIQSWRYNRYVDLDDPLLTRYKVPVSVKSGDVGMLESDDEGWSSPLNLDY